MDALSDVLAAIRLDGAVYIKAEFKAPGVSRRNTACIRRRPACRARTTSYSSIFSLTARAKLGSWTANEEVEVAAGDLLLFPHDNRHLLGSDFILACTGRLRGD